MVDPRLTPEVLREISRLSNSLDSRYDKNNDDWCGEATEICGKYLSSLGINVAEYYSNLCCMGGCKVDASHSYLILYECGTILDTTITQFIFSPHASAKQKLTASEFPTIFDVNDVAVIPVDHPCVKKMKYESHTHGAGFRRKPSWWPKRKKFCKPCAYCSKFNDSSTENAKVPL